MQTERPAKLIDPVCGMIVNVAAAEAAGLLMEYEGRTWAFCGAGCRRAFVEGPEEFVMKAEASDVDRGGDAHGHDHRKAGTKALPMIDEGMRRWYESCSCCLSDAYPEIKAQLDAERAAADMAAVDPGLCEVAEAATPAG